ncbi:Uncharacterized protein OBRU01_02463, partial [Operophtera brumata]
MLRNSSVIETVDRLNNSKQRRKTPYYKSVMTYDSYVGYYRRKVLVYALRLDSLYGTNTPQNSILPPFILNPRYF